MEQAQPQAERTRRAVQATLSVIQRVRPDDFDRPTPCEGWDVRALLNHMAGVCILVEDAARRALGDGADPSGTGLDAGSADLVQRARDATVRGEPLGLADADLLGACAQVAERIERRWQASGLLDTTLDLGFTQAPGTLGSEILMTDQLLHGWDLAQALGQPYRVDEDLAAAALAMMQRLYDPAQRGPGRAFAEPVPCPEDAPVQERLIAFSGRRA